VFACPGDTVKVTYDGNKHVPEIMVSDTVLQKSIMEYYSYDRSNGIYDSPVSYNLSPLSLFYKYTEGTLKRHLIRLQKYIEEHPGFDERAAYFYRTNIKAEQLDAMWSMLRRHKKEEEAPHDMLMLVKELSTDIPNPLTLGRYTTYMLKSYVSYCDENGLGVRINWPDKAALLEQDRLGVINLSKKEKRTLDEYEYLTSLKLALAMNKVGDTISAKKRVERLESVDKRYTQICEKYKVDTLPLWNKQNCMLIGDIMKTRRAVEDLHLPAEDCKYAISLLTYNQLASEEKSVNDTIISAAMEGLEDFAPAQVIVEQNNYLRRLEAGELEVRYLRNYADLTPETLVADSLLATILEPHRGKVVYADFWGSWCGPCKEQLKHMQAVKDELKGKDVVYLYFANNTPEDVRQVIVKKLGLYGDNIFHYNLPYEQQESIERLLGVTRFPTFMLFDKNGKLVSSDAPFPQHIDALINEINKCLE
jgi:thiol-disulfide isomerase/thioredoxin